MASPNSYKDPYWSDLASSTEAKLDLPKGLLVAVLTRGERSNADQVSEAGAETPFQIIPATRKAAIDKWGIDPKLSDENAAEVAGRLLKDSLQRNKGDAALAVAEYHGGTDRANWGPRTRAYVQRVVGRGPGGSEQAAAAPAASAAPTDRGIISRAYDAYRAGRMSPEDAAEFEADVNSGAVELPLGASLIRRQQAAPSVPQSVLDAYQAGKMSPQDAAEFEADMRANPELMPAGFSLREQPQQPGLIDRAKALPGAIREAVTGAERTTPETQQLPDWATMPELNSFSMASAKTGLGTLLSNPQETVKVIQANFPGVQVRQDEKATAIPS